jgi:sulfur relay (sulfurtransferase) complex TusBCD TusD component (DsrE family)
VKVLIVVNGPAYGSDETFNALRLAIALSKRDDTEPRVFLRATRSPAQSPDRRLRTATTLSTAC